MKGAQDRGRPPSLTPGGRVALDAVGRLRDWFDLAAPRLTAEAFAPADVARRFLARHAPAFGWAPALAGLPPPPPPTRPAPGAPPGRGPPPPPPAGSPRGSRACSGTARSARRG